LQRGEPIVLTLIISSGNGPLPIPRVSFPTDPITANRRTLTHNKEHDYVSYHQS